jgi:hypothetical protein
MKALKILALITGLTLNAMQIAAQDPDAESIMLETFGAVSGVLIYNSYIVIGAVADGFEYEVYDSAQVKVYMDEQVGAMENMARQYQMLYDSGYLADEADQEFVNELVTTCNLLKDEASALNLYVLSPTDENAQVFQDNRTNAWNKIAYLLGID